MRRYVIDFGSRMKAETHSSGGGGTDAVVAANSTEAILAATIEAVLARRLDPGKDSGESRAVEFTESVSAQFVSQDEHIREAFDDGVINNDGALHVVALDVAREGDLILLSMRVKRES